MATKRKGDGKYVVQMILDEDEYLNDFDIKREASGLTESSYLRVKCELPARLARGIPSKKRRRKKSGSSKVDSARAPLSKVASASTPKRVQDIPFVGHREEPTAEQNEDYSEILDELLDTSQMPAPSSTTAEDSLLDLPD